MSVQRSPPCERRRSHSVTDILINNQPLAVRPSAVPSRANIYNKPNDQIHTPSTAENVLAALLTSTTNTTTTATASATTATLALATLTTNTSTTTTASTITTTVSSATNATSIMCTTLKTSIAEESNNSKKSQKHKRLRSSPEKAEINVNKKTRKLSSKQQQLTYWLSKPPSENRFDILDQENELEETEKEETQTLNSKTTKPKYVPKPPPIYVQKVQVLSTLTKALNECIQNNYELKVLKNNEIKIQTKESTHYTATIKLLKERNTQYYTFRPKEEKGFKVILRNMHHSTDLNDIKSELAEYGHDVTNIFNILKSGSKQPLPLFSLEIKTNSNNKDIYNIRNLLHCKVQFEPPRQIRSLPQCLNCQKYGHTKNYCTKNPICVKCAGPHKTVNCSINESSNNIKCALCGEKHTANYKGCMVYKALRVQRFPALRKKELQTPLLNPPQPENTVESTRIGLSTYAQVAAQATNNTRNTGMSNPQNDDMQELKKMMSQLINQMTNMMNIITLLVTKIDGQAK